MLRIGVCALIAAAAVLSGCKEPIVKAPSKQYQPVGEDARPWTIGGIYHKREHRVTVTINGDNVLSGRFAPYTPKMSLPGEYLGHRVIADCEFTNDIIGNRIAESIFQAVRHKSGNTCVVTVDGRQATTLYF